MTLTLMRQSRTGRLLSPQERAEMALQDPSSPAAMAERGRRLMAAKVGLHRDATGRATTADEVLDALFWAGIGEEAA